MNTRQSKKSDRTNPKDIIGDTKPPLHLVPPALIINTAMVMKLGAKKYGPYNWRKNKVRRTVYLSAALRHILSALDGDDIDSESGRPHEANCAACMGIILDAMATGNLIDDRPTPGASARLIKELTETAASVTVKAKRIPKLKIEVKRELPLPAGYPATLVAVKKVLGGFGCLNFLVAAPSPRPPRVGEWFWPFRGSVPIRAHDNFPMNKRRWILQKI
jgi:hypothetical protein